MKKVIWKGGVVTILFIVLLGACAAPAPAPAPTPTPAPAPAPAPIQWRLAGSVNETHWLGRAKLWWADEISKKTNGRLKIQYFAGGTLAKAAPDALALVNAGTADVADVPNAQISSELKGIDVYALPGLVPADMQFRKKMTWAMLPEFKKAYEGKYDVIVLVSTQAEPRDIYTKKKIATLAELKGLKIRSTGTAELGFINALGAVGTNIVVTELYTALQTGVVDGAGYLASAALDGKLYEQVKFVIPLGYDGTGQELLISKKKFDALPADIQKIVLDSAQALHGTTMDYMISDSAAAEKKLLELGLQRVPWSKADVDAVVSRMAPVWQEWLGKSGPLGQTLFDKVQALVKAG